MALQPPTAQDAEPQSIEPTQASTPECTATEIPFEHEERLKREFNEFSEKSRAMSKSEANDATEPAVEWLEGTKLFMVIISLIFGVFLMLLDTSIIATAIPSITTQFHALDDVGWYGASYQLASAALQPLTGKFYTHFGGKWTFLAFFAVFELGSLLCGLAVSSKMFIVGRAVAGMGASGIQNGGFTIIAQSVPMRKRPPLTGLVLGLSQLGLVMGPLIGGALTEYTSWRWCFYINLPVGGVVAILLLFVRLPGTSNVPTWRTVFHDLDLIGFALFAPAMIQLLLALQYGGNQFSWNSPTVIGLFCGAGGTFMAFLGWEYYKGDGAMIPFSIMKKRVVYSSCIAFGLLLSATYIALYYIPIFFQAVRVTSPIMSGVYLLPSILFQLSGAIVAGGIVPRIGYFTPFAIFGGALCAIASGLLSTFDISISTSKWVGYQILLGAGVGIALQMPVIAVQNSVTPPQIPTAMALVMFSSTLGGALFLSFSQTILTNSLRELVPHYASAVDPAAVITAGATGFRALVAGPDLHGVLVAYTKSIDRVFYLCTGASVGVFVAAFGMGWKDIKTKKDEASDDDAKVPADAGV